MGWTGQSGGAQKSGSGEITGIEGRQCQLGDAARGLCFHKWSRGREGKLSFSGRKTGISGQENAGGTADTSGGRVRLQDKDSEKCYAKAAENISEHGNSGRNSAGSPVVVDFIKYLGKLPGKRLCKGR